MFSQITYKIYGQKNIMLKDNEEYKVLYFKNQKFNLDTQP